MADMMPTHYAPAERKDQKGLAEDFNALSNNIVVDSLLTTVGGLLAVLNDKRQIITVNENLMKTLDIRNVDCILGKRLGETLDCIHAAEMPGGCGTSKYCSGCGAVVAMVTSLDTNQICEEKCYIEQNDNGHKVDLSFSVRSCPITMDGSRFLLLFLQDISAEERWKAMQRVFFHDLNNVLGSVQGSAEMMKLTNGLDEHSPEVQLFNKMVKRLLEEISVHKILCENQGYEELTRRDEYSVSEVFQVLDQLFKSHPSRKGKRFVSEQPGEDLCLFTNSTLLLRILTNMLTNSFEASKEGDTVRLTAENKKDGVIFSVWNRQHIPEQIALRVFQRNFSTKGDSGRGLGTYGMKLFGEKILGGKVDFTTHEQNGTTFSLYLPVESA